MSAKIYSLLADLYNDDYTMVEDAYDRFIGTFSSKTEFLNQYLDLNHHNSYHIKHKELIPNNEEFIWNNLYFYIQDGNLIHVFSQN